MRKKDQMNIESKLKVVRFLGELALRKSCSFITWDVCWCSTISSLFFCFHNIQFLNFIFNCYCLSNLGELTKFQMLIKSEALFCLKVVWPINKYFIYLYKNKIIHIPDQIEKLLFNPINYYFMSPQRFFQDFAHHNIEMACSFLESCGRYLYRSPESFYRMKNYLVRFVSFDLFHLFGFIWMWKYLLI